MNKMRLLWLSAVCTVAVLVSEGLAAEQSNGVKYLDLIRQAIAQSRADMTAISACAEEAAKYHLAGGGIWAGGRQAGFDMEARNRAGGIMSLLRLEEGTPATGDIILYAVPGKLNQEDLNQIRAWRTQGIYVVAFASKPGPDDPKLTDIHLIPNLGPGLQVATKDQVKLIPTDTVHNVINLWAWTGEFVSACTRAGKMPPMYLSYGLDVGKEREKKYLGKRFHEDFKLESIQPGVLGNAYLDVIAAAVTSLHDEQIEKIHKAGAWHKATAIENITVLDMGHMFPEHIKDSRAPLGFGREDWNSGSGIGQEPRPERLVVILSYQHAPQRAVRQAQESGFKLVYNSVKPAQPAEPGDNVIYIKPGWPLPDACVDVPGYDVDILPGSGTMNAVTYWTILAEASEPVPTAPCCPEP